MILAAGKMAVAIRFWDSSNTRDESFISSEIGQKINRQALN